MAETTLAHVRTSTFTLSGTGFAGTVEAPVRWTRSGNQVTLYVPLMLGTSNATDFTLQPLPVALRPSQRAVTVVDIADDGVYGPGLVEVTPGTLTLQVHPTTDQTTSAWIDSGVKSLLPCTIVYYAIPGQASA